MKHKKLVIGTCIAVAAAVGGVSVTASAGTAIKTATAQTGQLDCELELNGKVESLSEKSYFAKIGGRIGKCGRIRSAGNHEQHGRAAVSKLMARDGFPHVPDDIHVLIIRCNQLGTVPNWLLLDKKEQCATKGCIPFVAQAVFCG